MASQPMSIFGDSISWTAQQKNQLSIANSFLQHLKNDAGNKPLVQRWGEQWAFVPEHEAMATELYMHLATYLVHVYVIPAGRVHAGEHMDFKSAEQAWAGALLVQVKRFTSSTRTETVVRAMPARARATRAPRALRSDLISNPARDLVLTCCRVLRKTLSARRAS